MVAGDRLHARVVDRKLHRRLGHFVRLAGRGVGEVITDLDKNVVAVCKRECLFCTVGSPALNGCLSVYGLVVRVNIRCLVDSKFCAAQLIFAGDVRLVNNELRRGGVGESAVVDSALLPRGSGLVLKNGRQLRRIALDVILRYGVGILMTVGSKRFELQREQPCAVLLNGGVFVKNDVLVPFLHIISIIQIFLNDVQRNSVGSFAYFVILPYFAYIEYNSLRRRARRSRYRRVVLRPAYRLGRDRSVSVAVSYDSGIGVSRRFLDLVEIGAGLFKLGLVFDDIAFSVRKREGHSLADTCFINSAADYGIAIRVLEEGMYVLRIVIVSRVLFGGVGHPCAGNFVKPSPGVHGILRYRDGIRYLDASSEPVVNNDRICRGKIGACLVHRYFVCRVALFRIGVSRIYRVTLVAGGSRRFKLLCAAEILRLNYVIKINIRIVRHTYGAAEKNSFRHTVISGSSGIQDLKRVVLQFCRRCHFLCDRYCECCHIRGSGSRDIAVELI